jgi:hypothetical protein
MTHYRAQPEDDAVLIVLCAVRDGQFGKSALNEVIDLWVTGQIGRTDSIPGAVAENERLRHEVQARDDVIYHAAKHLRHALDVIAAYEDGITATGGAVAR